MIFLKQYLIVAGFTVLLVSSKALSNPTTTTKLPLNPPSILLIPNSPTFELEESAKSNSKKIPGSSSYGRAWRSWSVVGTQHIRSQLYHNLPHPVNNDSTQKLEFELGMAADQGIMPSFADPGSRSGYALDFFCRVHLLADLLVDSLATQDQTANSHLNITRKDPEFISKSFAKQLHYLFQPHSNTPNSNSAERNACVQMTSIGGGPGYDFVALSLLASYRNIITSCRTNSPSTTTYNNVQSRVFDYEEGWADLVDAMSISTQTVLSFPTLQNRHNHTCQFGGKCDITQPLSHPSNIHLFESIPDTQLFICQYCVAENAVKLRQSNFIFFQQLFQTAEENSLFVFTETTHRLWPDFLDLIRQSSLDYDDVNTVDYNIHFPIHRGRGGSSGWQMFLHKQKGAQISSEILHQIENFRKDHYMHELKLEKGFTRQQKKIRGGK